VGLTHYLSHGDRERLIMKPFAWYEKHDINLYLNEPATKINTTEKWVESFRKRISFDYCVLATGSQPFVPSHISGCHSNGVFVYRTIEDIDRIYHYSEGISSVAIIGGGLLGLEISKAMRDLKIYTTIVQQNDYLLDRQLDSVGATMVLNEFIKLGVRIELGQSVQKILTNKEDKVCGLEMQNGKQFSCDMIIFATGITPSDDIARVSGIQIDPSYGGVIVNEYLETNVPNIFAIGEVASYQGITYGMLAPGYQMAKIVANNLVQPYRHDSESNKMKFNHGDLSARLRHRDIHAASFGHAFANSDTSTALIYQDPFQSIYKKYLFSKDGKQLLGGMMVGDTKDYAKIRNIYLSNQLLTVSPRELLFGSFLSSHAGAESLPDDAQICSCNNISKRAIRESVSKKHCVSIGEVESCTKAGTACGGCIPQVTEIMEAELKLVKATMSKSLCLDFNHSLFTLFQIVKIKKLNSFREIMKHCGKVPHAKGCEICKPAISSLLRVIWKNDFLEEPSETAPTDRRVTKIQRGGRFSIVPRMAGGEITPDKLLTMGQIAKKYGLYIKVANGQRIDLFGAKNYDLPDIWEALIQAGFESGTEYGTSLRTVNSCVGSRFCEYGVGDSVGLAIQIENRYKAIYSTHILKGSVSGCYRQWGGEMGGIGYDFHLIASKNGYDIRVCGNGGSKPREPVLLIENVCEPLVIKYLDRFLMYYISTAGKSTASGKWLDQLDEGIHFLRQVVIEDSLSICDDLEKQIQGLVNNYECEWKRTMEDPGLRRRVSKSVSTTYGQASISSMIDQWRRTNISEDIKYHSSSEPDIENLTG